LMTCSAQRGAGSPPITAAASDSNAPPGKAEFKLLLVLKQTT